MTYKNICRSEATYTGGGIYIYSGQFTDGRYFYTWDDGFGIYIVDEDPYENFEDFQYQEYLEEHILEEISDGSAEFKTLWNDILLYAIQYDAGVDTGALRRRMLPVYEAGLHRSDDDGYFYISEATGERYDIGEIYTVGAKRQYTTNLLVISHATENGYIFVSYLMGADDFPEGYLLRSIKKEIDEYESKL